MSKAAALPQPVASMDAVQLARRTRLTDAVIEMVADTDPERLQMKDVAERSGVALATAYRYFASKDHLLAASWAAWQRRLTDRVRQERRSKGAGDAADGHDVADRVVLHIHRELRAFQRRPNFAKLVRYVQASSDPYASQELAVLAADNDVTLRSLMTGVPPQTAATAAIAINATFGTGLANWSTGRKSISEVYEATENVTRLVLKDF